MLDQNIERDYEHKMQKTSLDEYWGAAVYLRRLLAQQEQCSADKEELLNPYEPITPEDEIESGPINFDGKCLNLLLQHTAVWAPQRQFVFVTN
jgi:hypothetical protein